MTRLPRNLADDWSVKKEIDRKQKQVQIFRETFETSWNGPGTGTYRNGELGDDGILFGAKVPAVVLVFALLPRKVLVDDHAVRQT